MQKGQSGQRKIRGLGLDPSVFIRLRMDKNWRITNMGMLVIFIGSLADGSG
jgi:hypothetical protein